MPPHAPAIAEAMRATLEEARSDARVPPLFLAQMRQAWEPGMLYAR